jgi:hypothetical protein
MHTHVNDLKFWGYFVILAYWNPILKKIKNHNFVMQWLCIYTELYEHKHNFQNSFTEWWMTYLAQDPSCPWAVLAGSGQAPDHWTLWQGREWSSSWRVWCFASIGLLLDWEWHHAHSTWLHGMNVFQPPHIGSHQQGWNPTSADLQQFSDLVELALPLTQHSPK